MHRAIALLALCASVQAFSAAPSGLSLRSYSKDFMVRSSLRHGSLRMQEQETEANAPAVVNKRRRSFWSRNLSEDDLNRPRYYDIEKPGEFLAGEDRVAEEELTEIGKWQRTMGPIYIQWTAGAMIVAGFADYFLLGNPGGSASPLWTLSVFTGLLGFALQRKTDV